MALQKFKFSYQDFTCIMSFGDVEERHRDISKPQHITQEKKEGTNLTGVWRCVIACLVGSDR
jgi:hypothetical protein